MTNETEIKALQNLIQQAQQARTAGEKGEYFLALPNDYKIQSLEALLKFPSRKKACPVFTRSASFCSYVKDHASDVSRLYVTASTQLVCVLNHHAKDNPDWQDHRAVFNLTHTEEWKLWTTNSGQRKSQRDFAQFIEDNSTSIVLPKGAELLDLIRTIKASQNLECTGDIDERGEAAGASFVMNAKNKAGAKQEVELPTQFLVGLSPYEGCDPIEITARLRLEMSGTKFLLQYDLLRANVVQKQALDMIVSDVEGKTDMDAWYGTP